MRDVPLSLGLLHVRVSRGREGSEDFIQLRDKKGGSG